MCSSNTTNTTGKGELYTQTHRKANIIFAANGNNLLKAWSVNSGRINSMKGKNDHLHRAGNKCTGRNSWANDSVNERVAKQKAAQNGGRLNFDSIQHVVSTVFM